MEQYDEARQTPAEDLLEFTAHGSSEHIVAGEGVRINRVAGSLPTIRQYIGMEVLGDGEPYPVVVMAVGDWVTVYGERMQVTSRDGAGQFTAQSPVHLAFICHSGQTPGDDRNCYVCTSLCNKAALARVDFS